MFGNLKEQQKEMQEKLAQIELVEETQGITVTATANQRIQNIAIDPAVLESGDQEQLEDLLLIAVNRALEKAAAAGEEEMQKMLKDMLGGGGMGDMLSGLF